MARRSKTSPKQIAVAERQTRALELRKAGVSLAAIADELGYASPSGAHEAVKAALSQARAEPAEDLRELMSRRLDEMLAVAYENAMQGDVDSMLAVLRIEERRARLFGVDRREAPVKADLPKLTRPQDALVVVGELLVKATNGELSPDEAGKLSGLVQAFMKIAETADLAERIAKLEEMRDESVATAGGIGRIGQGAAG
jgi:DNA-binding transcriptional MerR regulator